MPGAPSAAPPSPWELPHSPQPDAVQAPPAGYGPPPTPYGAPPTPYGAPPTPYGAPPVQPGWPAPGAMPPAYGYPTDPHQARYAAWWQRALALLLDWLVTQAGALVAGLVLGIAAGASGATELDGLESSARLAGFVAAMAVWLILAVITGVTGKSPGKAALGIKLVGDSTREPIGGVAAVGRWFAHLLDWLSLGIGWLFPLWDAKGQTFADKVVSSVVIRTR